MDPKVILETAVRREEVSAIEALLLFQDKGEFTDPILEVGRDLNERINGRTVTYVRSKQVHYTNICRADCSFCTFYRKKNQKKAFALRIEDVVKTIRETSPSRQVFLSGGLNPDLNLSFHVDLINTLREEFPNLHLHGYSPAEVHFLARRARTTSYDILRKLHAAGLNSLSGDSAEILNDKIRKKICPDKLRTADWIDIIKTAHRVGMPSTATMLFGHIEDEIHTCEHLEIIKNIQKETGMIAAFEPVPFIPKDSTLLRTRKITERPSMEEIQKVVAISRIFFGRLMKNIRIDWTKLGLTNTISCLRSGANDLGGLVVDRHTIRSSEASNKLSLDRASITTTIRKAGFQLQQRDPYSIRTVPQPRTRAEEPVLV